MRRVVTGRNETGRSIVISEGDSPRTTHFKGWPGFVSEFVWSTDPGGDNLHDTTMDATSLLPSPGGSRLLVLTIPPDAVYATPGFDPALLAREQLEASPGLAERFEVDHPGMHTTPTVDYVFVLSGQVVLELDDGATSELSAGDVVIQNNTRHAWRNPFNESVVLGCVLLGEQDAVS